MNVIDEYKSIESRNKVKQQIKSGEIYRIQPVDIVTFVESEDYLHIQPYDGADAVLSDPQIEYLETVSDFENGINFYALWVKNSGPQLQG